MRDDLSSLFRELTAQYKLKEKLLKQISENEVQLRYYLRTDNFTEFNELIKLDNEKFIELDSLEFDIKTGINSICQISGIEVHKFNDYFFKKKANLFPELKSLLDNIDKIGSRLSKERDELISGMENKLNNLKSDIDAVKTVKRLKNYTE